MTTTDIELLICTRDYLYEDVGFRPKASYVIELHAAGMAGNVYLDDDHALQRFIERMQPARCETRCASGEDVSHVQRIIEQARHGRRWLRLRA
jgi:hypothetical protein